MQITKAILPALLLVLHFQGFSQSPSFRTYTNPVIPGDHSDCTLTQVGSDFYTTGSSFNPTPVIYHSTDLVHWQAMAQPVSATWSQYEDRPTGGCWGGQVVYYNHKYWDFFSRANTMYFTTADRVDGEWSMPVKVNDPPQLPYGLGYDNSIFIDDNGKWYLVVKNGQPNGGIVELDSDGQPTGVVYDLKWLNPKPFPFSWAEGPVMWKHNGYYYYSFARDVSGGQKWMRSKTLTADSSAWSKPVDFFNESDPDKQNAIFFGPNHSSAAIELTDGTSWVVHPVWARANNNEWYGQGRQGLLNQVHYDANGIPVADYPCNKSFVAPDLPDNGIPWMVPHSDFFSAPKLNPEWSFLGQTAAETWSLTERPGWIRLNPKSENKGNTLIKTDAEHNYSLITRVDFSPKDTSGEAGLRIMNGAENMFVKMISTMNRQGKEVIVFSFEKFVMPQPGMNHGNAPAPKHEMISRFEELNSVGNLVWLKIERINHAMKGYFSADGMHWKQVGNEIDVTTLDNYTNGYNGWCGNRQGLYVSGSSADFDLYIYRDAYTPILAECPANHCGTSRLEVGGQGCNLDDIHNNDWALYAGVEFGNSEYPRTARFVQFDAEGITGGSIEIWLDSVDHGKKTATCKINSTKGSFQTFKAKIIPVTGRHDVYLKFTGESKDKLMVLKDFMFLEKVK
jgi:xylan 1,4-beta-xylosidase